MIAGVFTIIRQKNLPACVTPTGFQIKAINLRLRVIKRLIKDIPYPYLQTPALAVLLIKFIRSGR